MVDAEMTKSLYTTFLLCVVIVGVAFPVAVGRLREHHREVWDAMGSPKPFGSPFAPSTWHLVRFMVSTKHTRLDDLNLSLACVAFTLGTLAAVAGLVGLVLLRASGG